MDSQEMVIKKVGAERECDPSRLDGLLQGQPEKPEQIQANRAELERLIPFTDELEKLKARKSELQAMLAEISLLKVREAVAKRELDMLRAEYSNLSKQIDEAEKLKEIAERATLLEDERRSLESELRETRVQLERMRERKMALQLESEISCISISEEGMRALCNNLQRVEQELSYAQLARTRYERVHLLRQWLERLKIEGSEKRRIFEELRLRLDAMTPVSDALILLEKRIETLESEQGNSIDLSHIKPTRVEVEEKSRRSGIARTFFGEQQADGSLQPPRAAEFIAYLLPKKRRDPLLGDLQETYPIAYEKFGKFLGPVWYWWEVFQSVSVLVIKWGVIGGIIETIRKFIR